MSPVARENAELLPAPPRPGAAGGWALFLDVDGTLLDFAPHPADVVVDAALRADLAGLYRHLSGAVALLSGRPLAQLDALFEWQARAAAGLHGAELRMPDGGQRLIGGDAAFDTLRDHARRRVAAASGVLLEDKQRALALHYRRAPAAREAAERIAALLMEDAGDGYALQRGDHVIELKPAGVDKGGALATLLAAPPFHGRRPWVLGDDLTDEDAFEYANACSGVSVIVGARRPTAARHALADPATVRRWLHGLAGAPAA